MGNKLGETIIKITRRTIQWPLFWPIVLVILNLLVAFLCVQPQHIVHPDTKDYLSAMDYLQGKSSDLPFLTENRLLTVPLMLVLSIASGYLVGGPANGLMAVNIIFYFLIAWAFYQLAWLIFRDRRAALFGLTFFITNFCILEFGLARLADMGGWLFLVASTCLAVNYFLKKDQKFFWLAVAAASVGFLFKEYSLLGIVNLVMLIAVSDGSLKSKAIQISRALGVFLLVPLAYHLWFYFKYHFSYLNVYLFTLTTYGLPSAPRHTYNLPTLIKVAGWVFLAGWPLWLVGVWQEIKNRDSTRLKILLAMLPATAAFLFWPGFTQRVAFIMVPWLALIAGWGLSKTRSNALAAVILAVYAATNYNIDWLMRAINLPF